MKKITTTIALLLIALCFNIQAQQLTKVELMATGLTCSMCSNAINKQLKSMPDVEKVDIDLNKNLFIIILKKGNKLQPNDLKAKVEDAGFFVGSFIAYLNVTNIDVTDNKQLAQYTFIDNKPQTVNGVIKVKVLDKGFVTAKEYKKLQRTYVKYSSYNKENSKDYHIKII